MSKKIIGSVMTGALALSLITRAVPAAPVDAAGKVTYKVKGTTLTISGKGEMPKSMVFGKKSKTKNIKKVVIKKGVTTISKNAFKNCKKLKKVQLPSTLKKISGYAFTIQRLQMSQFQTALSILEIILFINVKN